MGIFIYDIILIIIIWYSVVAIELAFMRKLFFVIQNVTLYIYIYRRSRIYIYIDIINIQ